MGVHRRRCRHRRYLEVLAVDQLTDLIMIDLPAVGKKLTAGKGFGEVESVKAVSDLYAPVSGEVVEVNSAVKENASSSWATTPTRRDGSSRSSSTPPHRPPT